MYKEQISKNRRINNPMLNNNNNPIAMRSASNIIKVKERCKRNFRSEKENDSRRATQQTITNKKRRRTRQQTFCET